MGGDVNVPCNLLILFILFFFVSVFLESYSFLHASMSLQVQRSECCGTGRQSDGQLRMFG